MRTLPRLPDLTDDQKNIALLIAKGWTCKPLEDAPFVTPYWHNPDDCPVDPPPDYLHDERAAITLCDMLAEKKWLFRLYLAGGQWEARTWAVDGRVEFFNHHSLAVAISNCAILALNLATK